MRLVMEKVGFWSAIDELLARHKVVIDRPKGSPHPNYPELIYPLDYGYLAGTVSGDGEGIDVWLGSRPKVGATAIACTVDLQGRDAEIKILIGCTPEEASRVLELHNTGSMAAVLVERSQEQKEWET